MFDFESYIMEALNSFDNDPADTDYQRGYEAGLRDLHTTFMKTPTLVEQVPDGIWNEQQVGGITSEGWGGTRSTEGTRD
jgi:hypothetical protein